MMQRYHLRLVIRAHNDSPRNELATQEVENRVTAEDELQARRMTLNRAYEQDLLVSRILSVVCKGPIA